MSHHTKKTGLNFQDKDLLCKNGCGYYGNPAWHGYCSVCYRDVYLKQEEDNHNNSETIAKASQELQPFYRFETKRKQIADKGANTMKNIFKTKDSERSKPKPLGMENQQVEMQLFDYLKKLRKSAAIDISKQVQKFIDTLENSNSTNLDDHSLMVHSFYNKINNCIRTNPTYKGMTEENREILMDHIERYLTTRIYQVVFSSPLTDDEDRDIQLQGKIRSLHWITPAMLDAQIDEENPVEKPHIYDAITAIIELNSVMAPQDKLESVVKCCKEILTVLRCRGRPANADEFLPALIWVLLKANPPLLQSNINFVTRFANPNRLNSGEAGYFFTNLCCAVHFIENLTHESINLTADEYDRYMRGEGPCTRLEDHPYACEGIKIMAENDEILLRLFERYETLTKELQTFEEEFHTFRDEFNKEKQNESTFRGFVVDPFPEESPSIREILTASSPSVLDKSLDDDLASNLPAPLLPLSSQKE